MKEDSARQKAPMSEKCAPRRGRRHTRGTPLHTISLAPPSRRAYAAARDGVTGECAIDYKSDTRWRYSAGARSSGGDAMQHARRAARKTIYAILMAREAYGYRYNSSNKDIMRATV